MSIILLVVNAVILVGGFVGMIWFTIWAREEVFERFNIPGVLRAFLGFVIAIVSLIVVGAVFAGVNLAAASAFGH